MLIDVVMSHATYRRKKLKHFHIDNNNLLLNYCFLRFVRSMPEKASRADRRRILQHICHTVRTREKEMAIPSITTLPTYPLTQIRTPGPHKPWTCVEGCGSAGQGECTLHRVCHLWSVSGRAEWTEGMRAVGGLTELSNPCWVSAASSLSSSFLTSQHFDMKWTPKTEIFTESRMPLGIYNTAWQPKSQSQRDNNPDIWETSNDQKGTAVSDCCRGQHSASCGAC